MKLRAWLCVVAIGALGASCKSDGDSNKKDEGAKTPSNNTEVSAKVDLTTTRALFGGSGPTSKSVFFPEIELGMTHEKAQALWKADPSKFKAGDMKLMAVASDEKSVDALLYVGLPKDGVLKAGEDAWGPSKLDPAHNNPDFPVNRSCWFDTAQGIRACVQYDERMSWNALQIQHYLAAESLARDGLFVFERGASLIGMDYEGLKAQLLRFDDWPHNKNSFIPPTDFGGTNKLHFEFSEDGKVTAMSFNLAYVDDAHRERFLAGLASGLGEATPDGEDTWNYKAVDRTIVVKQSKARLKISVK